MGMADCLGVDVLIVGAGPVGLVIANELAAAGISATIIDRRNRPTRHSKANVIWPRSLELLARIGLTAPIMRQAHQLQSVRFHRDDEVIADYDFAELNDTPYPFALTLPQPSTEMAMEQSLKQNGVEVIRGAEVIDIDPGDDYSMATIQWSGGVIEKLRCEWIVGADGSRSLVRQKAGIAFDGEKIPVVFTLIDAYASGLPVNEGAYHFGTCGSLAIAPIGLDLFRFATSSFPRGEIESISGSLQGLLDAFNVEGHIRNVRYNAQFQAEIRQASTYRLGRILLAGDSAHTSTPASGQGMNTGIQDAVALGWRLAHVLLGHLDDGVLDEYSAERRSHVETVLAATRIQTAEVDQRKNLETTDQAVLTARQMTQIDTCYGTDAIRIPPVPDTIRHDKNYDAAAPAVFLYPGVTYSAHEWRQRTLQIRAAAPSYFQMNDLAGMALGSRYSNLFSRKSEALIVRPDQHLQCRLSLGEVTKETFDHIGWKR